MSNLRSAREAIKAEISHIKQGRDYYQMQLDKLETALAALEFVDVDKKQPVKSPNVVKAKGKKTIATASGSTKIPSTRGDFWINLITDQPQSAPDILTAAIAKLGLPATKEVKAKLSARLTNALTQLVSSKLIRDSGARRERRFFK